MYAVIGRRTDRNTWPDKEPEAEETVRSVTEITASMKEWEKVTGQKQRHNAKKSKQLATARRLAKIRDSETCDGKSQKWTDEMTFDQWGQRVVK